MREKINSMTRREFLREVAMGSLATCLAASTGGLACRSLFHQPPPNIIIIYTDDQGYADAGCYGAEGFETPNLDKMAANGVRFTSFYSPYASCSPSRAGLLTGCYPPRVGINRVLFPGDKIGLNPAETTIAEMLKPLNYATACVGKWHLGDHPEFLPTRQGFDEYFGLPYSNDMWPVGFDGQPATNWKAKYPPLPLIEGEEPVAYIRTLADQDKLTTLYTERAVKFIRAHRDQPFFLYLAHSMPHVPLGVSEKFRGKSRQGKYGDVIMEIDWSVGEIIKTLRELGLERKTLVVFTSDNGPWLNFGNHAGSAGPLREGKGTTWEGGQREICLMQWPGKIPPGLVCREMASGIDLLPTIAELTGAELPRVKIDGRSIVPLLLGKPGAKSPHEALFYHYENDGQLQCVRSGRWKLHFPHYFRQYEGFEPGKDGYPGPTGRGHTGWALYDLEQDIGERHNVIELYPDVAEHLRRLGEEHMAELRANARPPGRI